MDDLQNNLKLAGIAGGLFTLLGLVINYFRGRNDDGAVFRRQLLERVEDLESSLRDAQAVARAAEKTLHQAERKIDALERDVAALRKENEQLNELVKRLQGEK